MITLNNEKELVRIKNWNEIIERVDYIRDIDPSSISLESIIGSYVLPEPVPCGLSTCHQPHNRGYLVTTKNKLVTNIGNVCGKKHFSVDFQALRNKFNRDVKIKAQKEALQAFISRIPGYEAQISEIRNEHHGADWVYKNSKLLKTPNSFVPDKIRNALSRMLKIDDSRITTQREATKEERQAHEAASGRSHEGPLYIEDKHGSLAGLSALREENNLREIIVKDIQPGIERISSMDIEEASEHQLGMESKWAGGIESKLERVEEAILAGRNLLTVDNLQQLMLLLDTPEDKKAFKQYLVNLEEKGHITNK